ncbi:MAG TPA: hypothetical protein VL688_00650 [Verrucomicrobiae bacterium]|nr:hypothetical protein [Verrucomicrobiae bacterium]
MLFTFGLLQSPPPVRAFSAAPSSFSIPMELGTVEESVQRPGAKTILYLQDAHDCLEAQENIAKIIGGLVEKGGVRTVFEEGYEGPVPTDAYFQSIAAPLKRQVSYFLMDRLRLSAAEYAHVNRSSDFNLIGADNARLHAENIAWYRKNAALQSGVREDLSALQEQVRKLMKKFYPEEAVLWVRMRDRFHAGEMELLEYLQSTDALFAKQFPREEMAARYPRLSLVLEGKTPSPEALRKLEDIEARDFFTEIEAWETAIAGNVLTGAEQKQIFEYHRDLDLLARLSEVKVSPLEFEASSAALERLRTQAFADFTARLLGQSVVLSSKWEGLVTAASAFYRTAEKRDEALRGRLEAFKRGPAQSAVIVFGGFHKNNIKRLLEELGFSYQVVAPKISGSDAVHENYYRQLMTSQESPYDFEKAATAVPPERMISIFSPAQFQTVQLPAIKAALALEASKSELRADETPEAIEQTNRGVILEARGMLRAMQDYSDEHFPRLNRLSGRERDDNEWRFVLYGHLYVFLEIFSRYRFVGRDGKRYKVSGGVITRSLSGDEELTVVVNLSYEGQHAAQLKFEISMAGGFSVTPALFVKPEHAANGLGAQAYALLREITPAGMLMELNGDIQNIPTLVKLAAALPPEARAEVQPILDKYQALLEKGADTDKQPERTGQMQESEALARNLAKALRAGHVLPEEIVRSTKLAQARLKYFSPDLELKKIESPYSLPGYVSRYTAPQDTPMPDTAISRGKILAVKEKYFKSELRMVAGMKALIKEQRMLNPGFKDESLTKFNLTGISAWTSHFQFEESARRMLEADMEKRIAQKIAQGDRSMTFASFGLGLPMIEPQDVLKSFYTVLKSPRFAAAGEKPSGWKVRYYGFDSQALLIYAKRTFDELERGERLADIGLEKSEFVTGMLKAKAVKINLYDYDQMRPLVRHAMGKRKADYLFQRNVSYANSHAAYLKSPSPDDLHYLATAYLSTRNLLLAAAKPGTRYILEATESSTIFGFMGLTPMDAKDLLPDWKPEKEESSRSYGMYWVGNPEAVLRSEKKRTAARDFYAAIQRASGHSELRFDPGLGDIDRALKRLKTPVAVYLDYQDLSDRFWDRDRNAWNAQGLEIFTMAYRYHEKVKLVIYGADLADARLKPFRELSRRFRNVWILSQGGQAAFDETRGLRSFQKAVSVHLSKDNARVRAEFLKRTQSDLYFFRYASADAEAGLLAAALLWTQYEEAGRVLPGIGRDSQGFLTIVDDALRGLVREFEARLVVSMAA